MYSEWKNMNKTNIEEIKTLALIFLNSEINETGVSFVASHPFTNSWFTMLRSMEMVDLHIEENANKWRSEFKEIILDSDLLHLFMLLNKAYILNFLKFAEKYISDDDLGMIIGAFWQSIEQISLDTSMSSKDIIKLFKRANKAKLMDEEEYEKFNSLDDEITLYRGVTSHNKGRKKAMSWTTDKDIAKWFANRFSTNTGEIWEIKIPKERVLCVFDGRESEYIVDLYGFEKKFVVEKC